MEVMSASTHSPPLKSSGPNVQGKAIVELRASIREDKEATKGISFKTL